MIIATILWILKSLFLLGVLHLVVPVLINALTMNSWTKLPLMAIAGICGGMLMAWMHYVPYLLVFVWVGLTRYSFEAMLTPEWEERHGVRLNKPVFYASTYTYIALTCVLAYVFQTDVVSSASSSAPIPLWQWIVHH